MSTPLRVNDQLFQEAEAEASLMNRSTAKQVEFWAEIGKRVAHSVTPADMLALMQGIADVHIDIPKATSVKPEQIFAAVDKASATGQAVSHGSLYYEASKTHSGLLDQVMPDGSRLTGHFTNGVFTPE